MSVQQSHKVVFLGNSSVGKTSIINQMIYHNSSDNQQPTIGVDFFSMNITVGTDTIRIQIWDTAGQEQFHSLIPSYLRDSTIAIIVYDISNQESFQNLEHWIKVVQDVSNPALIMVGNKTDLEEIRTVSTEDGEKMAQSQNAKFIETSARTPSNIDKLIEIIGQIPISNKNVNTLEKNEVKINEPENSSGSGCFC